jgi:ribosomal protein S18 acetylase RimI-like enzyme
MDSPDPLVRAMEAGDLPVVVSIHMQTFPAQKSSLLGPVFLARFYRWFLVHADAFGLTAERDGVICGFAVGTRLGSGPAITRFTASAAVQALFVRPRLLVHPEIHSGFRLKLQQMRHPTPALAPLRGAGDLPTASLVGIGVAPDQQGCGVGKQLMKAFEAEAIRRGYQRACLSVRRENMTACRLYRRCGWDECSPPPTPELSLYVKLFAAQTDADRNVSVSAAGVRDG